MRSPMARRLTPRTTATGRGRPGFPQDLNTQGEFNETETCSVDHRLAFGLGTTAALAEEATGATSDITIVENSGADAVPGTDAEGKNDSESPGAVSAPEKDATGNQPSGTGGMTERLRGQRARRRRRRRQLCPEPGRPIGTGKRLQQDVS